MTPENPLKTALIAGGWKEDGAVFRHSGFTLEFDPPYRVRLTSPYNLLVLTTSIPREDNVRQAVKLIEKQIKGSPKGSK